jgi:hypothetical protein
LVVALPDVHVNSNVEEHTNTSVCASHDYLPVCQIVLLQTLIPHAGKTERPGNVILKKHKLSMKVIALVLLYLWGTQGTPCADEVLAATLVTKQNDT